MKSIILGFITALTLAGCGADGQPVTPTYSTKTTIGYNSATGPFNNTVFSVQLGG
ncbi:MAG: hypothetical protein V3V25_01210 [Paracoccaceae bacterium]